MIKGFDDRKGSRLSSVRFLGMLFGLSVFRSGGVRFPIGWHPVVPLGLRALGTPPSDLAREALERQDSLPPQPRRNAQLLRITLAAPPPVLLRSRDSLTAVPPAAANDPAPGSRSAVAGSISEGVSCVCFSSWIS